jgi:hypothetical protein
MVVLNETVVSCAAVLAVQTASTANMVSIGFMHNRLSRW